MPPLSCPPCHALPVPSPITEFPSSQDVVDIIAEEDTIVAACQEIVRLSAELWLENDDRTDDITVRHHTSQDVKCDM